MTKRRTSSKPAAPEMRADRAVRFLERQGYRLFPFLLFLVLRLFCGDRVFLPGGEQCTFLQLGRTFPKRHLFNHELYLIHSPVFGYAIGLCGLLLPLPTDLPLEVVYLNDKRVLGLPFDSSLLDQFIAEYRVSYLLTSSDFMGEHKQAATDQYTSRSVSRYIAQHPEKVPAGSRGA